MTCLTPLSSSGLRAFPPEIREVIFNFSQVLSWTGKTPALLVALRGDRELYYEALELFYKSNTFTLHRANEWKTGDMSVAALRTIRALKVDFWSSEDWEEWDTTQVIEPSTHDFNRHAVMQAQNIKSVHFNVSTMSEYNMKACLLPAVTCALQLPLLGRITVDLPWILSRRADDPYDKSGCIADLVLDFNHDLGIDGRLVTIGTNSRQAWFWEAEKGMTLGCHARAANQTWRNTTDLIKRGISGCWNPSSCLFAGTEARPLEMQGHISTES